MTDLSDFHYFLAFIFAMIGIGYTGIAALLYLMANNLIG